MTKETISLSGPQGNVFAIIGYVVDNCLKDQSKRKETIKHFIDMGNYNKIVAAVKEEYGEFIEFVE